MTELPATADSDKKGSKPFLVAGIFVVVLLLLAWPIRKFFFEKPPVPAPTPIVEVDPICQYVQTMQLNCVVAPAGEGVLGPGHFVAYSPLSTPHTKVPFPNGDLFSDACAVPGSNSAKMRAELLAQLNKEEASNALVFDDITFRLDRTFQAGADLPVPKLADLKLKAGPKMSEVRDISLKVPHGWLKTIDENQFINLLAGAAIQERCIERVIAKQYSVVSKAAIAQDYEVVVTEKAGHSFDLSAAVSKGEITADAGGSAGSSIDEDIKRNSATPVVVGVDFFDPAIFQHNEARLVSPIFSATASTNQIVTASDPKGPIWSQSTAGIYSLGDPNHPDTQEAGLNKIFYGRRDGGNVCGGAAEPVGDLTTRVTTNQSDTAHPNLKTFQFSTSGTLVGGVFRDPTFSCNAVPGKVEAQISLYSDISTVVRSTASTMDVELDRMTNGDVEVRDWNGKRLLPKPHAVGENAGKFSFSLSGPGVYGVRVSGMRSLSTNGPSALVVTERGTFTISVH